MKEIGGLFARFKHLQAPERTVRNAIIKAVDDVLDVEIQAESIKIIKESIVFIASPSVIKAALFEQKQTIITRANNILGKEQLKELR